MGFKYQLVSFILLQIVVQSATAGLRCFTCINAASNEECNEEGKIVQCALNEQSCQNEVRLNTPQGFGYLITKRCKQPQACKNNQDQNHMPAWDPTQCNLLFSKNSVCRCCCKNDLCNEKELPCSDIQRCPERGSVSNGRVTCSNNNFEGSSCVYRCDEGFELNGKEIVTCNKQGLNAKWSAAEPVCQPAVCKAIMQAPVNGRITCSEGNKVRSNCKFGCQLGYRLIGAQTTECGETGIWRNQAPKCERITCNNRQVAPDNGNMVCSAERFYDSVCQFTCLVGYYMDGEATSTCQLNSRWSSVAPACKRVFCDTQKQNDLVNGVMSCSDGNFFDSVCSYTCNEGFYMIGSPNSKCLAGFKWSSTMPSCEIITCSGKPRTPRHGTIVCSDDDLYASSCLFSCDEGYYMSGSSTTTCQDNFLWSDQTPECRRVFCDTRVESNLQSGTVSCSDSNFFGSECSYSCNEGFYMIGSPSSRCQADFNWSNAVPRCEEITCSGTPSVPRNGNVVCSDDDLYASACLFSCDEGYYMEGSSTTTCQDNFFWSDQSPECRRIICGQRHESIENGAVKCTEENYYNSVCKFSCNDGFFMIGSELVTCQGNFQWTSEAPICEAYTCGPKPESPSNGNVECSDDNKSFSKCEFVCGDGGKDWEYKGETTTTCRRDPFYNVFTWDNEPPCCAKRCPPFAQVDLFVVLDSSSSVGLDNWNKTLNFVAGVIKDFAISPIDMLIGAVRYNGVVDRKSEIKIGTYTDKKSTTEAIINLPYDGQGTNTGQALQYVVDNMLTHPGNRPNVQDMVLLVTDGISRDDVKIPAQKLRATGTNVVVLGISNKKGGLKQEDILDISNDPEKTVMLTSGFDGLSPDLVKIIINQICTNPCDRQNQYGDFGLGFGL